MVNSIKFDKKENVDGVIQHPMRTAIASVTDGFSPKTIVAFGKDVNGCREYDGLYKTLFRIKYGADWGKDAKNAEADLTSDKPKTNLRKYARGLYEAAKLLTDDSKNDSGLTKHDLINQAVCQGYTDDPTSVVTNAFGILFDKKKNKGVIPGLGPALACDFLKECGCLWLSKPDTHLSKVFAESGIYTDGKNVKTYKVLTFDRAVEFCEQMFEFAAAVRKEKNDESITPYKIDKMIWLMCTGNFYLEEGSTVENHRDLLIRALRQS